MVLLYRDMAGFVDEAQRTIEERFEVLEKEIYRQDERVVFDIIKNINIIV